MWLCKCGMPNIGIHEICVNNWHYKDCEQISSNIPDYWMASRAARECGLNMTEQEELYSKFYNRGKLLVADMDVTQLREHRENLAQIAFEAKATLAAADDELRERKAKTSTKSKEWLVTPSGPDQTTSDAINAVKIRKGRMSQMDRLQDQLRKSGIDEATVKEMITALERKATEKNLKTVTFTKPTSEPAHVVVQKAKEEVNGEPKPAFNPANLSFGK